MEKHLGAKLEKLTRKRFVELMTNWPKQTMVSEDYLEYKRLGAAFFSATLANSEVVNGSYSYDRKDEKHTLVTWFKSNGKTVGAELVMVIENDIPTVYLGEAGSCKVKEKSWKIIIDEDEFVDKMKTMACDNYSTTSFRKKTTNTLFGLTTIVFLEENTTQLASFRC